MHIGSRMKDLAKLCDLSPTLQSFFAFLSLSLFMVKLSTFMLLKKKERKNRTVLIFTFISEAESEPGFGTFCLVERNKLVAWLAQLW